ncbi:protein S100-A10-like [Tupaia chinensis]|uniref:protein S100-A10-like n=1 Tax=Tupaia chinensis TaxID=246437 RepID=UPI0003C90C57|nr:protein S100-A10-like [Tupaia chinensis]
MKMSKNVNEEGRESQSDAISARVTKPSGTLLAKEIFISTPEAEVRAGEEVWRVDLEGQTENIQDRLLQGLGVQLLLFMEGSADSDNTKTPSRMDHAMETIMFPFHVFAGNKGYLTIKDPRVLMEKKFWDFFRKSKRPLAVDKIMKDLDNCRDSKVGFQSFVSLTVSLTIVHNAYFVAHMKQKGKK